MLSDLDRSLRPLPEKIVRFAMSARLPQHGREARTLREFQIRMSGTCSLPATLARHSTTRKCTGATTLLMAEIWQFLTNNSGGINVITNILMLGVWALYFQLILTTYRHGLRPKILVNRAAGHTLDARCIITNMSSEKIYLESVLLTIASDEEEQTFVLTEYVSAEAQTASQQLFQGPLASGELIDIGSYRSLMDRSLGADANHPLREPNLRSLKITVVATYTAEDQIIGAERTFDVKESDHRLAPRHYSANQIRSGRRRAEIERYMLRHAKGTVGSDEFRKLV